MKRFFATILFSLYAFSIIPSFAQIHFCGEEIKAVQFIGEGETMDCCGTKKCCDCCHDVQITVDTDDHSSADQAVLNDFQVYTPSFLTHSYYVLSLYPSTANTDVDLHPPPLGFAGVKDIIRNQQLVLYA